MPDDGSLSSSLYFHHATAFGIAGQIDRPIQQTISTQASTSLSPSGGHGTHRVESYSLPGMLSFSAAYVTVGGSLDSANKCHATYACSVIEDLNISEMFTADKVVSRLTVYHSCEPANPAKPQEPNFSIAGSYFQNLRIAGRKFEIELASHPFNNNTYSDIHRSTVGNKPGAKHQDWMIGSHISKELNAKGEIKSTGLRESLEHNGPIVSKMGRDFLEWDKTRSSNYDGSYRCSAVEHSNLQSVTKNSGIINFGGIVCIPRFGVICLAELVIHKSRRQFTMFRVQMCSPNGGFIDGGSGGGGGGMIPPG